MFSMNFKGKMLHQTCEFTETRPVTPRVTKGHQIVVHLRPPGVQSVDGTSLANHKVKKSNNLQNNSGLWQYVTSVPGKLQPFTLR